MMLEMIIIIPALLGWRETPRVYIVSQQAAEVGFEPNSAERLPAAFTARTAVAPQAALGLIPPA